MNETVSALSILSDLAVPVAAMLIMSGFVVSIIWGVVKLTPVVSGLLGEFKEFIDAQTKANQALLKAQEESFEKQRAAWEKVFEEHKRHNQQVEEQHMLKIRALEEELTQRDKQIVELRMEVEKRDQQMTERDTRISELEDKVKALNERLVEVVNERDELSRRMKSIEDKEKKQDEKPIPRPAVQRPDADPGAVKLPGRDADADRDSGDKPKSEPESKPD